MGRRAGDEWWQTTAGRWAQSDRGPMGVCGGAPVPAGAHVIEPAAAGRLALALRHGLASRGDRGSDNGRPG
ncbi:hypothetical protein ABTK97_19980, partial [Acinetobacter baumannii]